LGEFAISYESGLRCVKPRLYSSDELSLGLYSGISSSVGLSLSDQDDGYVLSLKPERDSHVGYEGKIQIVFNEEGLIKSVLLLGQDPLGDWKEYGFFRKLGHLFRKSGEFVPNDQSVDRFVENFLEVTMHQMRLGNTRDSLVNVPLLLNQIPDVISAYYRSKGHKQKEILRESKNSVKRLGTLDTSDF